MSTRPRTTRSAAAAALLALGSLVAATVVTSPMAAAAPQQRAASGSTAATAPAASGDRYILRLEPGSGPQVTRAVEEAVNSSGGRVVAVQRSLSTVVVEVPAAGVRGLARVPGVRHVSPDRSVRATALGFSPSSQPGSMTNVTRLTGANTLWKLGYTGAGVDIALIDSGVAPVAPLKDPGKVVVGPDLSFESQDPDLRYLDTYGHGTHMAGIMAGREVGRSTGASYATDESNFYGMAPDARVVSLKLADHDGAVDVSQVIAAVDWVVQHRASNGLNIRILNLSYGTKSGQDAQSDPLSWAAEVAWQRGIVVVSSAGNDGASATGLSNPAYNPWVLAVGAVDTRGTDQRSDDVVAAFSARANTSSTATPSSRRSVDVVAPGVGIVSPGVSGSHLYQSHPGARVGNAFLRGNGTSQAAAVVSGGVALLLQQRPNLRPDEVKDLLTVNATRLAGSESSAQGAGEVDFAKAANAQVVSQNRSRTGGNGRGSLDKARGGYYVSMDGVDLRGEVDIMALPWDSGLMADRAFGIAAWGADGTFNGSQWIGGSFSADTTSWAGKTWSGKTWSGKTWSGKTWSGKTWSGKTWSNATWNGSGWSSASWPAPVSGSSWAGARWSTAAWK